jgi:FkbM family methyltransferase
MPAWFPLARCVNAVLPYGWQLVRTHPEPMAQEPVQEVQEPAAPGAVQNPPAQAAPTPARLYAYLSPDVALSQLYDGHFVFVDPADEQVAPHLIGRGYWEMWIDQMIRRLVHPGGRVIEVGANHGYYTLIMASLVGATGRLDSFEANPRLARLVSRSVEFNGYANWAVVHALAAGDQAGTVQFATWRHQSGGGHLHVETNTYADDTTTFTVPMVRLDDAVADGPVDLIRIDAEGAEPLILAGAQQILRRSPNIRICMEWAVGMMSHRADVNRFIGDLRGLGFRFWKIEFDSSLTELTDEALQGLELCDLVIARSDPLG